MDSNLGAAQMCKKWVQLKCPCQMCTKFWKILENCVPLLVGPLYSSIPPLQDVKGLLPTSFLANIFTDNCHDAESYFRHSSRPAHMLGFSKRQSLPPSQTHAKCCCGVALILWLAETTFTVVTSPKSPVTVGCPLWHTSLY